MALGASTTEVRGSCRGALPRCPYKQLEPQRIALRAAGADGSATTSRVLDAATSARRIARASAQRAVRRAAPSRAQARARPSRAERSAAESPDRVPAVEIASSRIWLAPLVPLDGARRD